MKREDVLSRDVITAAIEVHRHLGPGLLESAYEACLCLELASHGIDFVRQEPLPVRYKSMVLDCAYRLDIVIEDCIVLELKSVERLQPIHEAQLLTYLRLAQKRLGILLNFNVPLMKHGIKRIVNGL